MMTSFEQVQQDLQSTMRHGYALYTDDIFIMWSISLYAAIERLPSVTRAVNVQNGAWIEFKNGVATASVRADGTRNEFTSGSK